MQISFSGFFNESCPMSGHVIYLTNPLLMGMQFVSNLFFFSTTIFVHPSSPMSLSISLGQMEKRLLAFKVKANPERFKAWVTDSSVRLPVVFSLFVP